ncbi:Ppx/GppA phosphatase family protein [Bdellovibrio svalbardensis]|uniref:Ppx/GppA phosphatase N-terminal domain-containing protein n=1 Tax=Bdellovibrio svalbardensis TaxID=2972972 RepID=A0ABT6DQ28_9BACT|nr:hypothetical protein [Bdellovibrio svalbardensis]MDG0817248.1 hypothetical protein [Bdellovibrio svalbardensis]
MKIFTSLLFTFSFHFVSAETCLQNRGSLDIGSGTTKGLVAEVNVCEQRIEKIVFEDRLPLSFNEALEKSPDQNIPQAMLDEAIPKMNAMLVKMQEHKPINIEAVATSAFRVAKNGTAAAKQISNGIKIPVTVISQEQEAELGFFSALAGTKTSLTRQSLNKIIVWDIGGGSMQMFAYNNGKPQIYKGDLASVTFKNKVLQVLQFKDPKNNTSPNPLEKNREAALQLAKNHANQNVPSYFKKKAPTATWLAVGGVLSTSTQDQVNKEKSEFTQEELNKTLIERSKLNDTQIHTDYKTTDITNLALVLGYMQALKIQKVETIKASLGQGLMIKDFITKNKK